MSVTPARGKFKLEPPANRFTLHLRASDGTYAGPIVVGTEKNGKRAILGIVAGADLGTVKIRSRKGYAKAKRRLQEEFVDVKRRARARKGVPIGAANFGRVRSPTRGAKGGAPGDRDLDGIPEPLDIDDDGDLILDNVDRASAARGPETRASATPASQSGQNTFLTTDLVLDLHQTVNANAWPSTDPLTDQDVDEAISSQGQLFVGILNSQGVLDFFATPDGEAELDCGGEPDPGNPDGWIGGLSYCTRGGTGHLTGMPGDPFPYPCCDPDGDGFGTLTPEPPHTAMTVLKHGATTAKIGSGDVLIQRVTKDGEERAEVTSLLPYVFATVPALKSFDSFDDGQGKPPTTTSISYPVTSPNAPGTGGNGFPVSAPAGEDVVVTLTFWRPQREPIEGETGEWTDIGHLTYTAAPAGTGRTCPESSVSTMDPILTPAPMPLPQVPGTRGGAFFDLADDRPASPDNTLTYTLNLTQCLEFWGLSFEPGEEQGFNFFGSQSVGGGVSQQTVVFERQ